MKIKSLRLCAIIFLLITASAVQALSLGRVRGAVLLGKAFDVSVSASIEPNQSTPEASCFAAEVFYGESRVAGGALQLGVERAGPSELRVRVRANQAVDEPMATLYLRSTCLGMSSRRYVLLADSPTEPESNALSQGSSVAAVSAAPSIQTAPLARQNDSSAALAQLRLNEERSARASARRERERLAKEEAKDQKQQERDAEREKRQQQQTAAAKNGASQASISDSSKKTKPTKAKTERKIAPVESTALEEQRPRLKLDLLEVAAAVPNLRGSKELTSAPSSDDATRARARAMWQSLNAPDQSGGNISSEDLQALQNQVRTGQDQAKRQGVQISGLSTELEQAKKEKYWNPLVWLLGALALLGLGLAVFFGWRSRNNLSTGPWWGTSNSSKLRTEADEAKLWEHLSVKPDQPNTKLSRPRPPAGNLPATLSDSAPMGISRSGGSTNPMGMSPMRSRDSVPGKLAPMGGTHASGFSNSDRGNTNPASLPPAQEDFDSKDFGASAYVGGSRMGDAEELFDIQEQADFFLSLGQPDQAIEVLKNHISDNVETSALAYMDLFDIYHKTDRRADYDQLREEFIRVFNAQVPEFGKYTSDSRGLEDYPLALASIEECWPDEGAIELIEESIFRKPDAEGKPFDMKAYRELMLLYSVAKEIENSEFVPLLHNATGGRSLPSGVALSTATNTDLAGLDPLPSGGFLSSTAPGRLPTTTPSSAHAAKSASASAPAPLSVPAPAKPAGLAAALDVDFGLNFDLDDNTAPKIRHDDFRPSMIVDDNALDFDLSQFDGNKSKPLAMLRNADRKK